jgi:hypothetical protein
MLLLSEWEAKYKPTKNPNNDWSGEYSAFETYSPEVDLVWSKPNNLIWTEVDGEGTYIVAGKHLVNRVQYYICDVAWEDENEMVVVSVYQDCEDCQADEEDPACNICGGDGYTYTYPETREELIELVGEEKANG